MAAEGEQDDAVVIEELGPDGEPVTAAAPAEEDKAGGDQGDEAEEEDDDKMPDNECDAEVWRVEKEMKTMTAEQKLERATLWKTTGNECFKQSELFKATDAYYHAILFSRELMNNPQYYPKLKHTPEQRKTAQDLCESAYTNLALVQLKHAVAMPEDHADRRGLLEEVARSASEALKINAKNAKALFRRAQARAALAGGAKIEEAQRLLGEAKADLMAVIAEDAQSRDARKELKSVQEQLKVLRRQELEQEKKQFAFGSTLSALTAKESDLLGDGSIRKRLAEAGDGGNWMNEDWLAKDAAVRCVAHVKLAMLSCGGADGAQEQCGAKAVALSFVVGGADMHEGLDIAVRSMTVGEVSQFTIAPARMAAAGSLVGMLPDCKGQVSIWEATLLRFSTWADLERDGRVLQKIGQEGYGKFAERLSDVFIHWRIFGPDGSMLHSSRNTVSIGEGDGIKQVEDEDKAPPHYVIGEGCWEPLEVLCRSLRQGGVGELRMRRFPPLPAETDSSDDKEANVAAKLGRMMNAKSLVGEEWQHCTVRAEVLKVVPPLAGPEDPRWEGDSLLVQEQLRAEQLLGRNDEAAALVRLRRIIAWAPQVREWSSGSSAKQLAAVKALTGWLLASRAAPILDSGNVTSDKLAAATQELAEAEALCATLEQEHADVAGTHLLRAKIAVAKDDDFDTAQRELVEALRLAPEDRRAQEELKQVKAELRRVGLEASRAKVIEIRDGLKRARTEPSSDSAVVLGLLRELDQTRVPWETIMETRIGVELKGCQEGCGEEAKQLSTRILGRLMDESKEQRPMWET